MEHIFSRGRRAYFRQALRGPTDFRPPFDARPFPCLLWDHEGTLSRAERATLAEALIRSNCRYGVCAGRTSAAWHDALDEAFVLEYLELPLEEQERRHVMTTWHEGDTLNDVAFFFAHNMNFDEHDFTEFLVLHVGGSPVDWDLVAAVVRLEEFGEPAG